MTETYCGIVLIYAPEKQERSGPTSNVAFRSGIVEVDAQSATDARTQVEQIANRRRWKPRRNRLERREVKVWVKERKQRVFPPRFAQPRERRIG